MAGEELLTTQFVAAGCMFLLAGWLLYLRFDSAVNRAFALFLLVRGMSTVTLRLPAVFGGDAEYWARINVYFLLAVVPTLAAFVAIYGRPRVRRFWAGLSLAAGAVALLAYAADHCAALCSTPSGLAVGPLGVLAAGEPVAYGFVALWLAWDAGADEARLRSSLLVGGAFIANSVLASTLTVGLALQGGWTLLVSPYAPSPWVGPFLAMFLLGLAPSGVALVLLLRTSAQIPTTSRAARRVMLLVAGAALTGTYVGYASQSPDGLAFLRLSLFGLWRLVLPVLITYAILRHQLFDLDVRMKRSISRGVLTTPFVAVFFAVEQLGGNVVSDRLGWVIGLAAAGLLALALKPLHRFADRVAEAAMPGTDGAQLAGGKALAATGLEPESIADREGAYRAALQLALRDGVINRAEERSLLRLASPLGITPERAAALRAEVVAESTSRIRSVGPDAGPEPPPPESSRETS